MPVKILAGEEEFGLSRRLKDLKESLLDPAWATVNFSRLSSPSITTIQDAALTLPFGPGNRVVQIDGVELFTKSRKVKESKEDKASKESKALPEGTKKAKTKDELETFEEALASVSENTVLIFVCFYNFDETLKYSKAAIKHAQLEQFPKRRFYAGSANPELETWCRKEAKKFGSTIDDDAISYLLDGTEANLRQVCAEIEKAATFVYPKRHITLAIVSELSPYHAHIFTLAENWLAGRAAETMVLMDELLSRQNAIQILATMQTMLAKWILMKALCDKYNSQLPFAPGINRRELPLSDLVKKVSAELKQSPYMVEKELRRLSRHSTESLISKRSELTRMEHLVKTGQMPDLHALSLLISG